MPWKKALVPYDHPACVICGGAVVRRDGELRCDFIKRRTCGDQCKRIVVAAERKQRRCNHPSYLALATAEKICPVCEAVFKPMDGEHLNRFKRRKTCGSVVCNRTLAGRSTTKQEPMMENERWWAPKQEVDYGAGFRDDARAAANHGNAVKLVRQPTAVATMIGNYGSAA